MPGKDRDVPEASRASTAPRAAALRLARRGELGLLAEAERRAALCAAVVAGALAEVVLARERGMVAGLAAPLLLELDGFLALQWRILGAKVDDGRLRKLPPEARYVGLVAPQRRSPQRCQGS
jgi:hypothetical protein